MWTKEGGIRGRREGQVVTSAPYGKMQKGATVNWTRHTNSSSFSSSREYRVFFFFLAGSLNSQKKGAKLTSSETRVHPYDGQSICQFFNNLSFFQINNFF